MANGDNQVALGSDRFGWLKVSGSNVGLIFTVFGFVLTCLIAVLLFQHGQDAKESTKEFVGALKEQTVSMKEQTIAAREQNCLISLPQEQRQAQADFCKRISR